MSSSSNHSSTRSNAPLLIHLPLMQFFPCTFVAVAALLVSARAASPLEVYLEQHPISITPTATVNGVLQSNPTPIVSSRNRCPASCAENGWNPSNWTVFHQVDRLAWCNETMLLDFAIYTALDDQDTNKTIRSYVANGGSPSPSKSSASCPGPNAKTEQVFASLQMAWLNSNTGGSVSDVVAASQQIERYLNQEETCNSTISFAYSGQAALGIYAGSPISRQGITTSVLRQFISTVQSKGISDTLLVQLCGGDRNARYGLGIIANVNANLASVQNAVQTWANGSCITSYNGSSTWQTIMYSTPILPTATKGASTSTRAAHVREPRTTCSTVKVVWGDSCASLAAECGISAADFTEYNPSPTLCSTLTPGEHVCCSAGTLPSFSPRPNANGTCAGYMVMSGDTCSVIAATYSLTVSTLENFNINTWGWMGCSDLQVGSYICLSTGSPPMPAPLANAVCGPQVPGTPPASAGTNLSTINERSLNTFCDIWGQCGITSEFRTITKSPTGAPGTTAEETNGCISNCGTGIVESEAPAQFMKVGYFRAFDESRPCLSGSVASIANSDYTHVHLAFAAITPSFQVNVSGMSNQFNAFLDLDVGFKKIISFGGSAFSTDPSTYNIFRQAVTEANRGTLVSSIVSFVKKYGIDGVDFDWEYPGEPDIPGIPPGNSDDGHNYVLFLNDLRNSLQSTVPGTTVSIAAPASHWYLQYFPISGIGAVVDYIIYMTYDLHGQWDYGNAYSQSSCSTGNCLRSSVNQTETINALSMITKAGLVSSKIIVGVTSYGRSFKMTTANCYTDMCTFTGPASGAYPGPCTQTAGYLGNAEISFVNSTAPDVNYHFGEGSYSDILVFNNTQWVAWMENGNKSVRSALYQQLNFSGTADWAVDLQGSNKTITSKCKKFSALDGNSIPTCTRISNLTRYVAGTGSGNYTCLCQFSCKYNYCPEPFCNSTATGTLNPQSVMTLTNVCPVATLDSSYIGLCSFDCNLGHCPSSLCTKVESNDFTRYPNKSYSGSLNASLYTPDASYQDIRTCMKIRS